MDYTLEKLKELFESLNNKFPLSTTSSAHSITIINKTDYRDSFVVVNVWSNGYCYPIPIKDGDLENLTRFVSEIKESIDHWMP